MVKYRPLGVNSKGFIDQIRLPMDDFKLISRRSAVKTSRGFKDALYAVKSLDAGYVSRRIRNEII